MIVNKTYISTRELRQVKPTEAKYPCDEMFLISFSYSSGLGVNIGFLNESDRDVALEIAVEGLENDSK